MSSEPHVSPGEPITPVAAEPEPGHLPERASEVKFTRTAALWSSLILGFLILIVLLMFIAQNTAPTDLQFLHLHASLPLGVAILLAAVVGGLLTVLVGSARILQLRRSAKKHLKAAAAAHR
jgi:uncharacterized integral membrane protein